MFSEAPVVESSGRGVMLHLLLSPPLTLWSMQANARLEQAIRSREAAANYPALVDSVLTLVAGLNGELKKAAFA